MKLARLRPGSTSKTTILALSSALVCAAASWTFHAGSALAPGPADLTSPLSSSTGALAVAVVVEQQRSTVLLWPEVWTPGSIAVGTPCATYGLPAGARTSKRIEGNGSLRRCVEFDTSQAPPANAARPLPPEQVVTCPGGGESYEAVAVAVVEGTAVISWPADWQSWNDGAGGPYPGQPCSDFPLLAGETTYKHIQSQVASGSTEGPFRCVRMKDPIIYPGP
jgi:hypothetical protein